MVSLLCFCCDHRNPLGARFCNACGTPMHLRPCKHCEAINARAALHCHQCGETFDLAFSTDEGISPERSDVESHPLDASNPPADPVAPRAASRFSARRAGPVTVAVVAVAALLVAVGPFRDRLVVAKGSPLPEATVASLTVSKPLEPPAPARPDPLPDAPTVAPPAGGEVLAQVESLPRVEEAQVPPMRSAATKPATSAVKRSSATPARSGSAHRQGTARRQPVPPGDRALAASQHRRGDAVTTKSRRQATQPRTTLPGPWDRPCPEGTALEASCDVRMIAKGN